MLINNLVRVIFMFLCISATAFSTPTLKIASVEGFKARKLGLFSLDDFEIKLCAVVRVVSPASWYNRPQTVYEFIQLCNRNYDSNDHNSGWKKYLANKPPETDSGCFNDIAVNVVYSAFKELGVDEQYNVCFCLSLYAFMLKIDYYAFYRNRGKDALKVWFIQQLLKYSCSHFTADSAECLYQSFYCLVEEALPSPVENSPDDNSPDDNSPDDNSPDDNSPVGNLFIDGRDYVYNVLTVNFIKPSRRRRGNNERSRKHQFDYFELMTIYLVFEFFNMYGESPANSDIGNYDCKLGCLWRIIHFDSLPRRP